MKQQSPYPNATSAHKALASKCAAEHKLMNSIGCFQKDFTSHAVKQRTVCGWRYEIFTS